MKKRYLIGIILILGVLAIIIYSQLKRPSETTLQAVIEDITNEFTTDQVSRIHIFKTSGNGDELTIRDDDVIQTVMNKDLSIIQDETLGIATTDEYNMVIFFEDQNGFIVRVSEQQLSIDLTSTYYNVLDHQNELFDYLQILIEEGHSSS